MNKTLYNIFMLSLILTISCEDVDDSVTIDSRQDMLGSWLVTSDFQKVSIQPSTNITIIDSYNEGNGFIKVIGGGIDAELKYVHNMYEPSSSNSFFRVSNYPLGSAWEVDRVDYTNTNSASSYIETYENYYSDFTNTQEIIFNPASFTVGANHVFSSGGYELRSWDQNDYYFQGEFYFYLANDTLVNISLTVDSYPEESSWNLYNYNTSSYYYNSHQSFSNSNETFEGELNLPSGDYYLVCYDTFGDGGISGAVSIPGLPIVLSGSLTAATKTIGNGETEDIYSGDGNSLQTMTFNSDGTVILSYTEDSFEDNELDLWYIEDGKLIILDSDYDYYGYSNIILEFTIQENGKSRTLKSTMEWCEYLDIEDEEECNSQYSELETQLMLTDNSLQSIFHNLEFNLMFLGTTP